MCGISGFLNFRPNQAPDDMRSLMRAMSDSLAHRGPDASGTWIDAHAGVALGHRRLAVLDLSQRGSQPMSSDGGRYVVTLNGEIYNFRDLRDELAHKHIFRGTSDTEVMLAAFEEWGVENTLPRLNGMFAFAVWDRASRKLTLARDRVGEKPLYYATFGQTFLFASELKGLKRHPQFISNINRDALAVYLRHNYIPAPHCIYRDVYKLRPGHFLHISTHGVATPQPYWELKSIVESGVAEPFPGSPQDATETLDYLLRAAVRSQMVSDVPLGAFLSGGIDSSTVVAMMQAQSSRPVRTFTIGFPEQQYDEAPHARAVARTLGTDHTELYVTPEEAMAVIPMLPEMYDEPFADSSQIPTYLIAKLARRSVTVSLSGDGGDELFGGYYAYAAVNKLWKVARVLPIEARRLLRRVLHSPSMNLGDKVHKLSDLLDARSGDDLFRRFVSHRTAPDDWVSKSRELPTSYCEENGRAGLTDLTQRMMYVDTLTYLPDDILVKVDRAAMSVALETRVPLLDRHVIEFAWRIPVSMKVRDGEGKWLLRQVLAKYLPSELVDRPKAGFSIPLAAWLRGPLRPWAESLLSERRLREGGYLDPVRVRQMWGEHLSGTRNWRFGVWDVLMFQSWLDAQSQSSSVAEKIVSPPPIALGAD
jgi:asparagine synthase (glutamine-hydrolysing)